MMTTTKPMQTMTGNRSIVVQLDAEGNVVSVMGGQDGTMLFLSELEYVGDDVFIGSCCTDYLGVISKKEIERRMKEGKKWEPPQKSKEEL